MEYNSAIKKNKILLFTTTWMKLKEIMLSEMSDRERQILHFTYMWNLKKKSNSIKQKQRQMQRTN